MSRELIGMATKPQALKGQFRLKPYLNNLKNYKKLKEVFIDENLYVVENVFLRDTFVILKLEGINTCEKAELFRNKKVFAEIELKVETHFDFESFSVVVDNEKLGTIQSVNNFGSADVISILGETEIMVPIIDGLIKNINEEEKIITLDKEIFEQVAVYEN